MAFSFFSSLFDFDFLLVVLKVLQPCWEAWVSFPAEVLILGHVTPPPCSNYRQWNFWNLIPSYLPVPVLVGYLESVQVRSGLKRPLEWSPKSCCTRRFASTAFERWPLFGRCIRKAFGNKLAQFELVYLPWAFPSLCTIGIRVLRSASFEGTLCTRGVHSCEIHTGRSTNHRKLDKKGLVEASAANGTVDPKQLDCRFQATTCICMLRHRALWRSFRNSQRVLLLLELLKRSKWLKIANL